MRRKSRKSLVVLITAMFTVAIAVDFDSSVVAQPVGEVSEILPAAYDKYFLAQIDEGLETVNRLFNRPNLSARDSIAIYEFYSLCSFARGPDHRDEAYNHLTTMANIGICLNRLPQNFWPPELCDHWYSIMKERNVLSCPSSSDKARRTIAVMPFDNLSIGDYQEELAPLGNALADFFLYDFYRLSDLEVVERSKLNYLAKEDTLIGQGVVDAATAIRVGKKAGAHIMVFGSLTQFDAKNVRMVVRAVDVETGKILAVVNLEGKPEFNKMIKKLVKNLAEELKVTLSKKNNKGLKKGGTGSMDALFEYSRGLEAMDNYDYKQAFEYFKAAYELDDDFYQAKTKMNAFRPLAG